MTTPPDMPIEDRLRAHFADQARTVEIPGPEHDTALARAREGLPVGDGGRADGDDDLASHRRRRHRLGRRAPLFAAAAVAAVIALVAGVVLTGRDGRGDDVRTDPSPAPTPPTTTEPPVPSSEVPPVPTTTVAPAPPPPVTGPIVGHAGILGTWNGSAWVPWNPGDPAPSARPYQVVGVAGAPATVTGTPIVQFCGGAEVPTVDVGLVSDGAVASSAGVAVADAGDLQPRPVEVLDPAGEVYRQATVEVATSLGLPQPVPPRVTQVVRADLDGDGALEVVVVADQLADHTNSLARPGDWSLVFVRRVVGGAPQTTVVESEVAAEADSGFLLLHQVGAVADLNADGRMEVVMNSGYYEGAGNAVYEYADGSLTEVLSADCGS